MLKVLSSILCDLDPKVKVIGQKAGICDGVPSTSALVVIIFILFSFQTESNVSVPQFCFPDAANFKPSSSNMKRFVYT